MKTILYLCAAVLMFQVKATAADSADNTCQKTYGSAVASCAQSLTALSPNIRANAQKACVEDAKLAKDSCQSGANNCLAVCQTNFDSDVVNCETTYDPITNCGDDFVCQAFYVQARGSCINFATLTLNTCTASCPLL
jgi:hypothetical protein